MNKKTSYSLLILTQILISLCLFGLFANSAFAWKPSSHVYFGREVLAEVDAGSAQISFYQVDYANQEKKPDLIGSYPANDNLVNILRNNRDSFYAGIVGPDAFPDLPTGQTRIHIPCPDDLSKVESGHGCPTGHNHTVISDHWLQHIWQSSFEQNQSDAVRAFAFGFLTHAAGDMFMHTFVNHFAGGPFSSLSDNGLRHFLIESYVGKKTPPLSDDNYNIVLDESVQKFIYEKLTYAKSGSVLDKDLLIDVPIIDAEENAIFLLSVPRYFSTLKNTLDFHIEDYDETLSEHNETIADPQSQISVCVDRALDIDLLNDCSPVLVIDLSLQLGNAQFARDLYMTPRIIPMEYAREWSQDIAQGLYAWPAFSHEVLRAFVFSPDGMDKLALTEAWEDYKNNYFLKMLGVPDGIGENAAFIDGILDSIYTIETRRWVEDLKLSFVDRLIRLFTLEQHTLEDLEDFVKSPEANIPRFVNQPPKIGDNDDVTSVAVSIAELDDYMALNNGVFDINQFSPAHNTITMLKLMLLSEQGIKQLYKDLKCPNSQDCELVMAENDNNAMLGFIRTLDGGNEWHNHGDKMWFAECDVYQQLFMQQLGEEANIGENCSSPLPKLSAPAIFPGGNTFDVPVEITLDHNDPDADIYYTISFEDQPFEPSNNPSDSHSTLYNGAFSLTTPFTGAQPLVIRAKAFRSGFEQSDTVTDTFIINSEQTAPSFFPNNADYFDSVNVSMFAEDGSTIFYTTNGETPTYLSNPYLQPIHFGTGEYRIKAVSYRIGYAPSEISEFQFRVFSANDEDLIPVPRFNPTGSVITVDELEVSMFVDAEDADIYYTIGENFAPAEPTMGDNLYTGPLTLGVGSFFIKAKAFDPSNPSRVSLSRQIHFDIYESSGETTITTFDPPPGTYFNNLKVTAEAQTIPDNAGTPIIGYTTDGTEPVINIVPEFPTRKYNGRFINVSQSMVIKAQAAQKFFQPSEIVRADYRLQVALPQSSPEPDKYQNSVDIFLDTETDFAKLYYTLDGTEPSKESLVYIVKDELPIVLTESATLKVKGFKNGFFDSEVFVANYRVEKFTAPVITEQPLTRRVFVGASVQLMSAASGNPEPNFQWFKNDEFIEDANKPYLLLNNTKLSDAADYYVEVSNEVGLEISDKIILEVVPLPEVPVFLQQPSNAELHVGDQLRLTAEVNSEVEPAYQWFFNGLLLANQNKENLVLDNVGLINTGDYQLLASNRGGDILSDLVRVTVINPELQIDLPPELSAPEIISQPTATSVVLDGTLQLSVAVNAIPQANYLWFHGQRALPSQRDALLVINDFNQEHVGEYFVLIQNSNGSVVSEKVVVTLLENDNANNNSEDTEEQNNETPPQNNNNPIQEDIVQDAPVSNNQGDLGETKGGNAEENNTDDQEGSANANTENTNSDEQQKVNNDAQSEETSKAATGPVQLGLLLLLITLFRRNCLNLNK